MMLMLVEKSIVQIVEVADGETKTQNKIKYLYIKTYQTMRIFTDVDTKLEDLYLWKCPECGRVQMTDDNRRQYCLCRTDMSEIMLTDLKPDNN